MVNGFLIIDKPVGLSSHDVVNRVRRILGTKKVGHTGTLDPFATGVLPVAVGEGTKAIQFLDEGQKEYLATIRLGVTTDTLDVTGTVLHECDATSIAQLSLLQSMSVLTGEISQLPPMYSAVKQGGQPLYKLARKGLEVERQPRRVLIHQFELLLFEPPVAEVRVLCSRGTYVRSLADDLGRLLGCGACLTTLRRSQSGPFRLDTACSLEQLADAVEQGRLAECLVTVEQALMHLQLCEVSIQELQPLRNGVLPRLSLVGTQPGLIQLRHERQLLAVAEMTADGQIELKRVFN
ncbi:MAG: tRNA pseudouridine(55) synthase TruB [Geobacter sp.]|nr:tRNA pseudouridine(55) synthase TruB [Geobacter sp.]